MTALLTRLPARPRTRDATVVTAALGGLVSLVSALFSRGFLWQDEYAHLLFSRWVFAHPEVAVDLWGRPLATLAYALPSLAGLWGARLLTIVLAVLAALWTGRAAERRGLHGPLTSAVVLAQPVFLSFAFGALPGTLFAAILARVLLEDARGRRVPAAVAVALLPLARVEGALVVVVYAVALWRRGDRRAAVIPFAGLAVWNLAGWAVTGSPLFLLTANPYPTVGSIYPTGGFFFLARVLPVAAGAVVLLLAQAGVVATLRRPSLLHGIGLSTAVFLTLVWGVPLFASAPTPVYLIGFAPLLALFAAEGWRWLRARATRLRLLAVVVLVQAFVLVPHRTLGAGVRHLAAPVDGAEKLALAAGFALIALGLLAAGTVAGARRSRVLAACLIAAAVLHVGVAAGPVPASAHERVAAEAASWYRAHRAGTPVTAVAPDFMWHAGADPFANWEPGALPADAAALERLPRGHLLVWDSQFSAHEGRTSLEALAASGWSELARFAGDGVTFVVLERR